MEAQSSAATTIPVAITLTSVLTSCDSRVWYAVLCTWQISHVSWLTIIKWKQCISATNYAIKYNNFANKKLCLIVPWNVFYQQNHRQKQSINKTLVDNLWFVDGSVGTKFTDTFTDRKTTQKNMYLASFHISICKFNISSTRKSYVIPLIFYFCFFIRISILKYNISTAENHL